MPRHIGIIMDGNGRWAQQRGLPRTAGHRKAADVFGGLLRHCEKIGLEYLTVYAFSTENWKRPQEEIDELMNILRRYLKEARQRRNENKNTRLLFLGDRTPLPTDLCQLMADAEQENAGKTGLTVCLAINYGGRDELLQATRLLAQQVREGTLEPSAISMADIERNLYTAGLPDPDLIIRTSGEKRSSNFLTWQSVYSEFVFMDVLWPDFTPEHLEKAIEEYAGRGRRFGGV